MQIISAVELEDIDSKEDDNDNTLSTGESMSIARQDTCPSCLGQDLCLEITNNFLTISLYSKRTSYGDVYKVMKTIALCYVVGCINDRKRSYNFRF